MRVVSQQSVRPVGWLLAALAVTVAAVTFTATAAFASDLGSAAVTGACGPERVLQASADAWIDQSSPQTNKGSDSILKVRSQGPSGNFRALVRFDLPPVPAGCVVESATLRLYAASARTARMLNVRRLAASWSEGDVNWANQPPAAGDPATTTSALGWREWTVTAHVTDMATHGNHGFVIRDATEGETGEQQFHSREKGSSMPQLVLRYGDASAPPPPVPLECGTVVTASAELSSDLLACPGHGLVIGASGITLDLGGHTVGGTGIGVGILNDGFHSVTITNGAVRHFDHGLRLGPGTTGNLVEKVRLEHNDLTGMELIHAGTATTGNRISASTLDGNHRGLVLRGGAGNLVIANVLHRSADKAILVEESSRNRFEDNEIANIGDVGMSLTEADDNLVAGTTFTDIGDSALALVDSDGNAIEGNTFDGAGDSTVILQGSDGNTVTGNTARDTSDAAFVLEGGSSGNLVERNVVGGATNDDGFRVLDSDRNRLLDNVAHGAGDSGIVLARAHDNVVRGNDLRSNVSGLELDHANGNRLEDNDASHSSGIAIEISNSLGNQFMHNVASHSGGRGIEISGSAGPGEGNVMEGNVTDANNASGIVVASSGHTLRGNLARNNSGWGMHAAPGTVDGGGNRAVGNTEPGQCFGITCLLRETDPSDCEAVTLTADADAWIDQNSAQTNKGTDSILKVRSQGPSGNFRALVRFDLPTVPAGCVVESATLRLYAAADSSTGARTLQAQRLGSHWRENEVTWTNQPSTTGPAAKTQSGPGYREWTVTAQVQAMLDEAANHGFLIRDEVEGQSGEQQFHSREKGALVPELLLRQAPSED